jgi:general secretion pathway protein K
MTRARTPGQSGFILLIVLWTMVLLAMIGTQLAAMARGQASVAVAARDAAMLETAADGAVDAAIFHLLTLEWEADAQPHTTRAATVALTTTISNEAGRINPNLSPYPLQVSLLRVLGLDPQAADDLAMAMLNWRTRRATTLPQYQRAGRQYGPSGAPFQTIDELGLVLGMTPELLAQLRPHLSLFQEGDVDIRYADPIVARALGSVGSAATPLAALRVKLDDQLVRVRVQARATGGRSFQRSAEIRLFAHPEPGTPRYAILSWDSD